MASLVLQRDNCILAETVHKFGRLCLSVCGICGMCRSKERTLRTYRVATSPTMRSLIVFYYRRFIGTDTRQLQEMVFKWLKGLPSGQMNLVL
ncbi:hypothetical protein PsorP6_017882 [Peronosclerospora sorghi]|uniref:Uncharacterized protein n=1 Tax=Peronosclerospora sorghi TaxID=230839 RepID=A0ACC0WFS5_9STRA|nr:hypothetical protein PsorP6_017882 [Peronosclerospora sorghi]